MEEGSVERVEEGAKGRGNPHNPTILCSDDVELLKEYTRNMPNSHTVGP